MSDIEYEWTVRYVDEEKHGKTNGLMAVANELESEGWRVTEIAFFDRAVVAKKIKQEVLND